jgi:serine/threonine-protein kinase
MYMSPEHLLSSKNIDGRADIWALGIIAYELLTGEGPFLGDTMPQVLMKVMGERTPSVRAVRPDVPRELEAVIMRCTEKDAAARFQTVAELAEALRPVAPPRSLLSIERVVRTIHGAASSNRTVVMTHPSQFPVPSEGATIVLPPVTAAAPVAPPAPPAPSVTIGGFGNTQPGTEGKARTALVITGVVCVSIAAAVGLGVLRAHHLQGIAASVPSSEAPTISSAPIPPPPVAPSASPSSPLAPSSAPSAASPDVPSSASAAPASLAVDAGPPALPTSVRPRQQQQGHGPTPRPSTGTPGSQHRPDTAGFGGLD